MGLSLAILTAANNTSLHININIRTQINNLSLQQPQYTHTHSLYIMIYLKGLLVNFTQFDRMP